MAGKMSTEIYLAGVCDYVSGCFFIGQIDNAGGRMNRVLCVVIIKLCWCRGARLVWGRTHRDKPAQRDKNRERPAGERGTPTGRYVSAIRRRKTATFVGLIAENRCLRMMLLPLSSPLQKFVKVACEAVIASRPDNVLQTAERGHFTQSATDNAKNKEGAQLYIREHRPPKKVCQLIIVDVYAFL